MAPGPPDLPSVKWESSIVERKRGEAFSGVEQYFFTVFSRDGSPSTQPCRLPLEKAFCISRGTCIDRRVLYRWATWEADAAVSEQLEKIKADV